jgi:hypothetical protein
MMDLSSGVNRGMVWTVREDEPVGIGLKVTYNDPLASTEGPASSSSSAAADVVKDEKSSEPNILIAIVLRTDLRDHAWADAVRKQVDYERQHPPEEEEIKSEKKLLTNISRFFRFLPSKVSNGDPTISRTDRFCLQSISAEYVSVNGKRNNCCY